MPKKTARPSNSDTFHKRFMTVTPLSKCIALFFFILLPIFAFVIGARYQRVLDQVMLYQTIIPTSNRVITLTALDNGMTKYAQVGDTLQVTPDGAMKASLMSSDEHVVKPDATQSGLFKALKPGEVTLSGTLAPICRRTMPCPQLIIRYSVDIVVK